MKIEGMPSQFKVNMVKNSFPEGTRIEMLSMQNDPDPIPTGTKGTVKSVDDMGTLLMSWDNGRTLGVCVLEGDEVKII
ncbi:DUF4314 domain-containing protein [Vibrio parahaemolyticus]|uniref:DUF4314 domain-containing protein n=1 Tax=Vibrio parahaemolyticus TaxID=670 RepID=UPI000827A01F|nr:DUF4314 domain-containing protein [Vibrio parahaemolyticus]OCP68253.1 hypothetical protein AKH08_15665 [Vibrio parahaemolyticus]